MIDEDTVLGLFVFITWAIGILVSLAVVGFICWGIYRLIIHFL